MKRKMKRITRAEQEDMPAVVQLLEKNKLPAADLSATTEMYVMNDPGKLIACGALEYYSGCALLRSVCVEEGYKNAGLGKELVKYLETIAVKKKIRGIYLLTTTAEKFFTVLGYKKINRMDAPDALRKSSEFAHVCPDTAVCMGKTV